MTRALAAALLIALLPSGAGAVSSYADCTAMVDEDPERARNEAVDWYAATGALGALHCEALALAAEGAFRTAAQKLAALAGAPELSAGESVAVRVQAARLYRADHDLDAARAILDEAIAANPGAAAAAYVERAALQAEDQAWTGAKADLDSALRLQPRDAEALALRAAARRHLGDAAGGVLDAKAAIAADPGHAPGWLELGVTERARGDAGAARKAFLGAIEAAPDSPSAAMARNALQDMAAPEAGAPTGTKRQGAAPASPSHTTR